MKIKNDFSQGSQRILFPIFYFSRFIIIFITVLIFSSSVCTTLPDTPPNASPKVQVQKQEQQIRTYEFILSPVKRDKPGEYSRREIESFLCALARDFIKRKDVYKDFRLPVGEHSNNTGTRQNKLIPWYAARYKVIDQKKKESLENLEINKWFEERVTLICKGYPLPEDIKTVNYFIDAINGIIGREKFVYMEDADVGNINVEFSQAQISSDPMECIGESACLQDNLGVVFYKENKLDEILTKGKSTAVILQINIGLLKYKLERLEEQVNGLQDQTNPKRKLKKNGRQIALWKEDLEVLTEILGEVKKNENRTRQLQREEKVMDFADHAINRQLRRIVRQLGVIAEEMTLLQPGG